MLSTAELESWCEEQAESAQKDLPAAPQADVEPTSGRETVRSSPDATDRVRAGQLVSVHVSVWRRSGPLERKPSAPEVSERHMIYHVAGPEPRRAPGSEVDDLDEWLQLPSPRAAAKAPWCAALDECLMGAGRGEVCRYQDAAWLVEAEVTDIFVEREAVDTSSARATGFGEVAGYARSRRLASAAERTTEVTEGCVVRGTIAVVRLAGEPRPEWFGLGGDEWSGSARTVARIGAGVLAEGFEAALCKCRKDERWRIVVAGDLLLPDEAGDKVRAEGLVCVDVRVDAVDDSASRKDVMKMTMDRKESLALELKDRGARLWAAGRRRRAELVWNQGVRLFNFIKPEDSGFDPHDEHLRENERGRRAAVPLLLNEALAMRTRGALRDALENLHEAVDNDPNHVKALFRRGQLFVDLGDLEGAREDFRRCLDLGGPRRDVHQELKRLKAAQRVRDAKDGLYFKDAFDRDEFYADKPIDAARIEKRRAELRQDKLKPKPTRAPVVKTSPGPDWTKSYDTKARPKIVTKRDGQGDHKDIVVVDDLEAEIEDIHEEEAEAHRQAKEDYYNTQIGLGNMRLHLPPDSKSG